MVELKAVSVWLHHSAAAGGETLRGAAAPAAAAAGAGGRSRSRGAVAPHRRHPEQLQVAGVWQRLPRGGVGMLLVACRGGGGAAAAGDGAGGAGSSRMAASLRCRFCVGAAGLGRRLGSRHGGQGLCRPTRSAEVSPLKHDAGLPASAAEAIVRVLQPCPTHAVVQPLAARWCCQSAALVRHHGAVRATGTAWASRMPHTPEICPYDMYAPYGAALARSSCSWRAVTGASMQYPHTAGCWRRRSKRESCNTCC